MVRGRHSGAELAKQVAAKVLASSATVIGGQAGLQLSIHALSICANALAAKKLGPKVAQKVSAKIAKKLAAKATTRWIPFISAAASGGANWWILAGICDAADQYADFVRDVAALAARKAKAIEKKKPRKPSGSETRVRRPKPG